MASLVSVALVALIAVPAAAGPSRLIIGGSTSVLPLMQKLAAAYHKQNPKIPLPLIEGGQTDIGIEGVAKGTFDIADASRNPLETDPKGLEFVEIARDAVCIITNKANPLSSLSQESVEGIFTGSVRDWSEVPGAHASGPIDLFDRSGASGTQDAFQQIFLGEKLKISPSATPENSDALEQSQVGADSKAIGFVSAYFTAGVNPVGYLGVPCTLRNARAGQYEGVRNFFMVTKGHPKGQALKFIQWVTSGSKTTKSIISSSWIVIH
jgi:phosphate transport system substrate-binding protein